MAKTYQYTVLWEKDPNTLQAKLTEYGPKGWRLVHVWPHETYIVAVLELAEAK